MHYFRHVDYSNEKNQTGKILRSLRAFHFIVEKKA